MPRAAKAKPEAPAALSFDQGALLATWRKTRSPAVADVLQLVPLDDKWTARLKAIATTGTSRAVQDRLRGLPDDDPRVTVFLIECLRKPRWPGAHAQAIWKLNFKRLVDLGDARAIAPLRAAASTPPHFLGARHTAWIVGQCTATADALVAVKAKPDDAATRALVAGFRERVPAGGWLLDRSIVDESLLQPVWDAPDDDAIRAVVADALLERGDPRGELISLQLHGAKQHAAEIKQLVRKHTARFAGPIVKITNQRNCTFEKGFLARVAILGGGGMTGRRLFEEAARAPHWATVHTTWLSSFLPRWWLANFLATVDLTSLRAIHVGNIVLARATRTGPWAVTKAAQRVDAHDLEAFVAVVQGMPAAERARMPPASSKSVRQALERLTASSG